MLTSPLPELTTAKSGFPSPLKSPTAAATGAVPTGWLVGFENWICAVAIGETSRRPRHSNQQVPIPDTRFFGDITHLLISTWSSLNASATPCHPRHRQPH